MTSSFGTRLARAVAARGPVCAGIDPHPQLLDAWGFGDSVRGLAQFCRVALDGFAEAAVIKPQVAFFERFGARGYAVLETVLHDARELGVLTILDAKRGDIGSTMEGYAQAVLPVGAPLEADAVTLSPYMGVSAYRSVVDQAGEAGKGVFVLALTSNPEGRALQRAAIDPPGVETVASSIIDWCEARNRELFAGEDWGSVGIVVGATVEDAEVASAGRLPGFSGPILAPGFGAQGASEGDVRARFGAAASRLVINSSRGLLAAGPNPDALARSLAQANEECRTALAGEEDTPA